MDFLDFPEEVFSSKILPLLGYEDLLGLFLVERLRVRFHHLVTIVFDDESLLLQFTDISLFHHQVLDYSNICIESRPCEIYFIKHLGGTHLDEFFSYQDKGHYETLLHDCSAIFNRIFHRNGSIKLLMLAGNDTGSLIQDLVFTGDDRTLTNTINHVTFSAIENLQLVGLNIDPMRIKFCNVSTLQFQDCLSNNFEAKICMERISKLVVRGGNIFGSVDFEKLQLKEFNFYETDSHISDLEAPVEASNVMMSTMDSVKNHQFKTAKQLYFGDIRLISKIDAPDTTSLYINYWDSDTITLNSSNFPIVEQFAACNHHRHPVQLKLSNLQFPQLKFLSFNGQIEVNLDGKCKLTAMKSVSKLDIFGCTNVPSELLECEWTGLKSFRCGMNIESKDVAHGISQLSILNAPNLQELYLNICCKNSDKPISRLLNSDRYHHIRKFELSKPQSFKLKKFTSHHLTDVSITVKTSVFMQELQLPALKSLSLKVFPPSTKTSKLSKLNAPNLERLLLHRLSFSSLRIDRFPKLERLHLYHITCWNILALQGLWRLESLVTKGSRVRKLTTDASMRLFQDSLPNASTVLWGRKQTISDKFYDVCTGWGV